MLLHDKFGDLQATARIIRTLDGIYSIVKGPVEIGENLRFADAGAAIAFMQAQGFEIGERDFRGNYDCTHAETAAAIEAEAAARIEAERKLYADAKKGFIRFGKPPKGGRSYNYRDGRYEEGVSCYHAEFARTGECRLMLDERQKVQVWTYSQGRDAYRVWGTVIGTGSDGEPLLKVTKYARIK